MAQKYLVQVTDDLDGTELVGDEGEQVQFGLDGVSYVIDLSAGNAAGLRQVLDRYAAAARRDSLASRAPAAASSTAPARRGDLDQVRVWAAEHGYQVSARGRVPAAVLEAYDAR